MKNATHPGTLLVVGLLWLGMGRPGAWLPGASASALGQQSAPPPTLVGRTIRESGTLVPGESVEIRNEAGQPLSILFVAPQGETVKKGDLLVELDVAPLLDKKIRQELRKKKAETELVLAKETRAAAQKTGQGAIAMAEKALHLAQTQLKAFHEGEYPLQLATAERSVVLAKERLALAGERLALLQANAEDPEAKARLGEAQLACAEAKAQVETAKGELAYLTQFVQPQRTEELEFAVVQREFELARARDELLGAGLRTAQAMSLAETTYNRESARLDRWNYLLERSKMYAPRDGVVVYPEGETPLRPGVVAGVGQVLVRLADMKQLNLEVRAGPQVGRLITAGQPATIRFHGFPQRAFRGHVANVRVAYSAAQDVEQRSIAVQLDNPSDDLRIGMTALIDFDVSEPPPGPEPTR
jgi:HlyD family secretion protein